MELVHFSSWGLMKPQPARARRRLPGVAANGSHLRACETASEQSPAFPRCAARHSGAHAPPDPSPRNTALVTNSRHSGASWGGARRQSDVRTLRSPEMAFRQMSAFCGRIARGQKSLQITGTILHPWNVRGPPLPLPLPNTEAQSHRRPARSQRTCLRPAARGPQGGRCPSFHTF